MIINGKQIADQILQNLQQKLARLSFQPLLCDVLVGDDPVSLSYVNIKEKTAQSIGLGFRLVQLPEEATTEQIIAALEEAQQDKKLCGLIVQLPLPETVERDKVLGAINPWLDVDVINPHSAELFYQNQNLLTPPTAAAIMEILDQLKLVLSTQNILVIGQGELVGKPVTHLLQQQGYQVSVADRETTDLSQLTKTADVIISGTGQGGLVDGEMIKVGSVIIDAGTSESGAGIVGDVDIASVRTVAAAVSPVPGGVGPVTVAKLLENVVQVAQSIDKGKVSE